MGEEILVEEEGMFNTADIVVFFTFVVGLLVFFIYKKFEESSTVTIKPISLQLVLPVTSQPVSDNSRPVLFTFMIYKVCSYLIHLCLFLASSCRQLKTGIVESGLDVVKRMTESVSHYIYQQQQTVNRLSMQQETTCILYSHGFTDRTDFGRIYRVSLLGVCRPSIVSYTIYIDRIIVFHPLFGNKYLTICLHLPFALSILPCPSYFYLPDIYLHYQGLDRF